MIKMVSSERSLLNRLESEDFAIISANKCGRTKSENKRAHKLLYDMLTISPNHDIYPAKGCWAGIEEDSYLVFGISKEAAVALGEAFMQESIVVTEGILYTNGCLVPKDIKDIKFGIWSYKNNYTEVDFCGEKIKFSL